MERNVFGVNSGVVDGGFITTSLFSCHSSFLKSSFAGGGGGGDRSVNSLDLPLSGT